MTIIQLSESPELQSIKQQYEDANIEFEPVLKEANSTFKRIHGFRNAADNEVITFVLTFLSEYLLKQLKPKKTFGRIVKAILTLGVSLWMEKRKAKIQDQP